MVMDKIKNKIFKNKMNKLFIESKVKNTILCKTTNDFGIQIINKYNCNCSNYFFALRKIGLGCEEKK